MFSSVDNIVICNVLKPYFLEVVFVSSHMKFGISFATSAFGSIRMIGIARKIFFPPPRDVIISQNRCGSIQINFRYMVNILTFHFPLKCMLINLNQELLLVADIDIVVRLDLGSPLLKSWKVCIASCDWMSHQFKIFYANYIVFMLKLLAIGSRDVALLEEKTNLL